MKSQWNHADIDSDWQVMGLNSRLECKDWRLTWLPLCISCFFSQYINLWAHHTKCFKPPITTPKWKKNLLLNSVIAISAINKSFMNRCLLCSQHLSLSVIHRPWSNRSERWPLGTAGCISADWNRGLFQESGNQGCLPLHARDRDMSTCVYSRNHGKNKSRFQQKPRTYRLIFLHPPYR